MTPVTGTIDFDAGVQPSGREPAPGSLGLVQAFVNTHYDLDGEHGAEVLSSPRALRDWLAHHGLVGASLELTRADLRAALEVREGLRAMLAANNGAVLDVAAMERLNRAARRPGVVIQFAPDGDPTFEPARRDLDSALAFVLAIVARSQLDGSWKRFKACPGHDCGWAFYDYSRNQASAWCSMAICGSRAKARAYRSRNRRASSRR
jgi:predicted RNA-binding Zn ribbon-like protein